MDKDNDAGQGRPSPNIGEERIFDEATVKPLIGENMVLSNRDKAQHAKKGDRDKRGLDSKWVETEQLQDHDSNKLRDE